MRLRRITLVAFLILVGMLVAAFLTPTSRRGPEVRLVRLVSKTVEPTDLAGHSNDWLMVDFVRPEQEVWAASFDIPSPLESGFVLSKGDIKVEIVGQDGNWTAIDFPRRHELLQLGLGDRIWITKGNMNFTVPGETRRCRFTIGFRPLTLQERCSHSLAKWGLWRRFPKLSARISRRLPNTERWTECRREVVLSPVLLEQETHNEQR